MALKGRIKGATHRLILRLVEKVEHGHIVVQGAQIKRLRRSAIGILIGDPAEALEAKRELLHGMHHESDSLGDVRHHLVPRRVAIVCLRGLTHGSAAGASAASRGRLEPTVRLLTRPRHMA